MLFRQQRSTRLSNSVVVVVLLTWFHPTIGFSASSSKKAIGVKSWLDSPSADVVPSIETAEDASFLLAKWDKFYSHEAAEDAATIVNDPQKSNLRKYLASAVQFLSSTATQERTQDSTQGRCVLGICASSTEEGIATLKSWVTSLQLQRGLLHGADKDGVPLEIEGGVYIKYNSGGVYSFAEIRKSGQGFDALWKPGDCMLEPYDGTYRGVYFQVELTDGEFRQYLVPLDTFVSQ